MIAFLKLLVNYQTPLLIALGGLLAFYLYRLVRSHQAWDSTTFGLERQLHGRRRNWALLMILLLGGIVYGLLSLSSTVLPIMTAPTVPPRLTAQVSPTPSPIVSNSVSVDSAGCENPEATLTAPKSGDRITGAYEVEGTANIINFGFYQLEISGANTRGKWIPVDAGNEPVVAGKLGSFDAGAYESGDYAFRLTVFDNTGQSPPPCLIVITLVNPRAP